MHTNKSNRVYVIYDSICNSVFESQVLLYLNGTKKQYSTTHLVTYEHNPQHPTLVKKLAKLQDHYTVTVYKQYPFIHRQQLLLHSYTLRKLLKTQGNYTLVARGALAGYIAQKAATASCSKIIIQARGLLAQEYSLSKIAKPSQNVFQKIRFTIYENLEKKVYSQKSSYIEAVSHALQEYLIEHFGADKTKCCIAHHDIPKKITKEERHIWRQKIRKELSFDDHAHIYCYNGSAKPWQCPHETIEYFIQQYKIDHSCRLLILTQETDIYIQLLHNSSIPQEAYRVLSVKHKDIYHYLCACDSGLLFRKKHSVNWTARPTKALEYYATGLTIIHNNTIAYLNTKSPSQDQQ